MFKKIKKKPLLNISESLKKSAFCSRSKFAFVLPLESNNIQHLTGNIFSWGIQKNEHSILSHCNRIKMLNEKSDSYCTR